MDFDNERSLVEKISRRICDKVFMGIEFELLVFMWEDTLFRIFECKFIVLYSDAFAILPLFSKNIKLCYKTYNIYLQNIIAMI